MSEFFDITILVEMRKKAIHRKLHLKKKSDGLNCNRRQKSDRIFEIIDWSPTLFRKLVKFWNFESLLFSIKNEPFPLQTEKIRLLDIMSSRKVIKISSLRHHNENATST